ncbi:hypothetical protein COB52_00485 [Candidatus Kaiserbacteria bacterium]|nr:MAG: hypothetical protein COB52_00485 [Candidatus Kaiserbacteria bacterium]
MKALLSLLNLKSKRKRSLHRTNRREKAVFNKHCKNLRNPEQNLCQRRFGMPQEKLLTVNMNLIFLPMKNSKLS